jgi:predicted Zn-dependent protease
MNIILKKLIIHLGAAILTLSPMVANAGIIRDAEIEHTLRAYADPIFQSAGIPPEDVRLIIVGDPTINAFVAGGLNMFINTGLIRATKNPSMLIGVIAHETGHISGAHLSQVTAKSNRALLGSVISAVLGAAIMAGGAKDAGAGILVGGQSVALRSFLSEIRINEQSADHAAMKFLDDNEISSTGMLEMFETLRRNESGAISQKDPYLLTHPLTSERVATVRNHIKESKIPKSQIPSQFKPMHERMVAKLVAFSEDKATTLKLYPESRRDVAARYAHAIAYFRAAERDKAIAELNTLIKQHPNDAFFYDTLGQVLFENGALADAAKAYKRASDLFPDSALILTDYGKTLIAQEDAALLPRAIALLERAKSIDDSNDFTWRQLAIAYGKQGNLAASYAALAEESALQGNHEVVLQHVKRARGLVERDSAIALQIDDLDRDAREQLKKKKENSLF